MAYESSERHVRTRLRNGTGSALTVTLETPVPSGFVVEDIRVNGNNGRYRSAILDEFGRIIVRAVEAVESGQEVALEVSVSTLRS